jgi:hypothetical protein
MSLFEIIHSLFTHGNITEHDLESLSEIKSTLFFQFFDDFFFSIFKNSSGIEESLGKEILVERFKDVLILQIPKYLNYFINFFRDFLFCIVFEIFFELLV